MLPKKTACRNMLRPYRQSAWGLSILTVLQSVLQVTLALMSRFVIDAAQADKSQLTFWAVLLVANVLAVVGIHGLLAWLSSSITDRLSAKLRQQMLRCAVFSRDSAFIKRHSGALMSRSMEDVRTICDGTVNVIPAFVGHIARLVSAFAAVIFISGPVAVVLFAVAAVIGVVTTCLRTILRKNHRMVRHSDEEVMSVLQENMQHLEVIQGLGVQKQIQNRFAVNIAKNLKARLKLRIWSVISGSTLSVSSQLGTGALLLWGAAGIAANTISYGSLTALIQLVGQFRAPVMGLSGLWTRMAAVDVAAERLEELLVGERPEPACAPVGKVREIVFEHVDFAYPGEEAQVLKDFSFRFGLDSWACLTGVSGKGKTTIFKLMLGLYTPQSGRIYLQTDEGEIPCTEETRHVFAYVPQDYVMFSGTILENMQLVDPDVEETQLREVFQAAQADFVWELTEGLQTQVRENNSGLSKGQLQRLAIARAILMERQIFLLDECTSALDAATETGVLQGLQQLGKQAILVTHRPEAFRGLDDVQEISMEQ